MRCWGSGVIVAFILSSDLSEEVLAAKFETKFLINFRNAGSDLASFAVVGGTNAEIDLLWRSAIEMQFRHHGERYSFLE